MRNYISFFEPGGVVVPDKYFIELKNAKGEPTGHKMLKGTEFVIAEDVIKLIQELGKGIKKYAEIKKNLPKVNENSSNVTSSDIGTTISTAIYRNTNPSSAFSVYLDNSSDSSGI